MKSRLLALFLLLVTNSVFAYHIILQGGGYLSTYDQDEDIEMVGMIGDEFKGDDEVAGNGVLGLGVLFDAYDDQYVNLNYGINAFYLFDRRVNGLIYQEHLYPNLEYDYQIANIPVYAVLKSNWKLHCDDYEITVEGGLGANAIHTSNYEDVSLDGGITHPDNAFGSNVSIAFSATAGVGFKFNHVWGDVPFECGYRFFYLGEGHLKKVNDQVINNLPTGKGIANAFICSATF